MIKQIYKRTVIAHCARKSVVAKKKRKTFLKETRSFESIFELFLTMEIRHLHFRSRI